MAKRVYCIVMCAHGIIVKHIIEIEVVGTKTPRNHFKSTQK